MDDSENTPDTAPMKFKQGEHMVPLRQGIGMLAHSRQSANRASFHQKLPRAIEDSKDVERIAAAEAKRKRKAAKRKPTADVQALEDERSAFERECSCHISPPCGNCIEHSRLFPEEY